MMSANNKWTRFAEQVNFKGMTANNKAILEYIAYKQHSNGCTLTYRQIGSYVGITKQSAKNNVNKLSALGLVSIKKEYPMLNCKLPLRFTINLNWKGDENEYQE